MKLRHLLLRYLFGILIVRSIPKEFEMPKTLPDDDLTGYVPVATRLSLFFEAFPSGQVITKLISRENGEITFRASVYRTEEATRPAATGWASEVVGDGDINDVACLENTETSAVGRALANLGFAGSVRRPSLEEMAKVSRARARLRGSEAYASTPIQSRAVHERLQSDALQRKADLAADAMRLVSELESRGVPESELNAMKAALLSVHTPMTNLEKIERALRRRLRESELWSARGVVATDLSTPGVSKESAKRKQP